MTTFDWLRSLYNVLAGGSCLLSHWLLLVLYQAALFAASQRSFPLAIATATAATTAAAAVRSHVVRH